MMLNFCLRSLLREYGWQFMRHVALPHPVKTARALRWVRHQDFSREMIKVAEDASPPTLGGTRSVVGAGFCQKPIDPPCPSGRANHDCQYLESLMCSENAAVPTACRQCAIRQIGIMALRTGAGFYIMTSARDILFDVFAPALNGARFSSGLFVLCRYSLMPFSVGLVASGIQGWMFPYEEGDCANYKTWLLADRGIKEERTFISPRNMKTIRALLGESAKDEAMPLRSVIRRGNILYPI